MLWSWDTPSVTIFDITNVFVVWNAGDLLGVTISSIGNGGDWKLELASSTFTRDYSDAGISVSEPATMIILGSSLIGLASYGRKKLFKKATGSKRLSLAHS